MATADAAVYTPNTRNTPAKRYAYTGTTHAVGPVGSGSGEAKPSPEAMELATLAISEGSVKSARVIGFLDRKSTRLNSSHLVISYAVFCLKKKKKAIGRTGPWGTRQGSSTP